MRQSRMKGFTLIELLIVVAIIAILAAIAVPNFLEAQVRSKVARVQNDLRTLSTALESYYIDNNDYPQSAGSPVTTGGTYTVASIYGSTDTNESTVNSHFAKNKGAYARLTFATYKSVPAATLSKGFTLTTPMGYITSIPSDPFADTKGCAYGYWNAGGGFITWSYGPDTDEGKRGDLESYFVENPANTKQFNPTVAGYNSVYNPTMSNPSTFLLTGWPSTALTNNATPGAFTYDSTNGTVSEGDVYRVKN